MEILKYLDVLIGLAVVMVLLSPLVSAFTQFWMWLTNSRSGRLQVGLTNLILELNGNPFERFETAAISGLPPNAPVTFAQPPPAPPVVAAADAAGSLLLTQNVPAMLAANGGSLLPALTLPAGPDPVIQLIPRDSGAQGQSASPLPNPLPPPVSFAAKEAEQLAGEVLLHPLVAQPQFWKIWSDRKGEVVEREEFIRLLLGFAAEPGASPLLQKLRQIVARNDITDPGRALAGIRDAAQYLELTEGGKAAHERLSKAILQAAPSSFVGRINNWFDQVMDRTTAEYKFRAQLVTILGAFLVASVVQLDSIDLLKRLSNDDKLRDSLVKQAQLQETRIEDQTKPGAKVDPGELENAKAQRDEIQADLAKLRDPQLAILPDHYLWQRSPGAHLAEGPSLAVPLKGKLELVAGGGRYALQLPGTEDPFKEIEAALRTSGAPVDATEERHDFYTITGDRVEDLRLNLDGKDGLLHKNGLARAELKPGQPLPPGDYYLLVGSAINPIHTTAAGETAMRSAIEAAKGQVTLSPAGVSPLALTAVAPDVSRIELRSRGGDPASNVLDRTRLSGIAAYFDEPELRRAKICEVAIEGGTSADVGCTAGAILNKLQTLPAPYAFAVRPEHSQRLLLTSSRLGPLQLRQTPGAPETDMLTSEEYFDWTRFWSSLRGVVLTWVLLSLGAPFWYDALKDLLKLRSTLAKKEEDARIDRQTNDTGAKTHAN